MGLSLSGSNHGLLKEKIAKLGLDTSHWYGQLWSKGKSLKDYSDYKHKTYVKNKLIRERSRQCEKCKLTK